MKYLSQLFCKHNWEGYINNPKCYKCNKTKNKKFGFNAYANASPKRVVYKKLHRFQTEA